MTSQTIPTDEEIDLLAGFATPETHGSPPATSSYFARRNQQSWEDRHDNTTLLDEEENYEEEEEEEDAIDLSEDPEFIMVLLPYELCLRINEGQTYRKKLSEEVMRHVDDRMKMIFN